MVFRGTCSVLIDSQIFGADAIHFSQIPERVNRFLMKADPIILHYTLDPTVPPPEKPVAYDIEIKVDDIVMKSRMTHAVVNMTAESQKELAKLDEEVCCAVRYTSNIPR